MVYSSKPCYRLTFLRFFGCSIRGEKNKKFVTTTWTWTWKWILPWKWTWIQTRTWTGTLTGRRNNYIIVCMSPSNQLFIGFLSLFFKVPCSIQQLFAKHQYRQLDKYSTTELDFLWNVNTLARYKVVPHSIHMYGTAIVSWIDPTAAQLSRLCHSSRQSRFKYCDDSETGLKLLSWWCLFKF